MAGTAGKLRGPEPADGSKRRRLIALLVGAGILAASVALAIAVRKESCDIETRVPEERVLLCNLQNEQGTDPDRCDPEVTKLPRERCEELMEPFLGEHGPGTAPSP